jgi:hypothetical protein
MQKENFWKALQNAPQTEQAEALQEFLVSYPAFLFGHAVLAVWSQSLGFSVEAENSLKKAAAIAPSRAKLKVFLETFANQQSAKLDDVLASDIALEPVLAVLQEDIMIIQNVEPVEQQKSPALHNYDIEKLFPDHVYEKSLDDWLDGLKIKKDPILQLDDEKTKTKKTKKRAQQSLEEDETLVTETLAKLYVIQKKWDKAQKAYMALVHKFPERKAFFEEQMKEIETEIEKNKN